MYYTIGLGSENISSNKTVLLEWNLLLKITRSFPNKKYEALGKLTGSNRKCYGLYNKDPSDRSVKIINVLIF